MAENGLVDRERNVRNRSETRNSVDSFVSGAERTETVAANGGSIARIWIVRSFRADFWSQLRTLTLNDGGKRRISNDHKRDS